MREVVVKSIDETLRRRKRDRRRMEKENMQATRPRHYSILSNSQKLSNRIR